MFTFDILRNFIIDFKTKYKELGGELPIYRSRMNLPEDNSYISIYLGTSNEVYDEVKSNISAKNQPIMVEISLFRSTDVYSEVTRKVYNIIESLDTIPIYDFSSPTAVLTTRELNVEHVSQPYYIEDGSYSRTAFIVDIVNLSVVQ